MKSIIQEASSIAKAVELGWIKANKPENFSIKILEEAETNFFGFTKKSAKIAIIFDEHQPAARPRTETRHRVDERSNRQNTQQRPDARQQYNQQRPAAPRRSHSEDGRQQQERYERPAAPRRNPGEDGRQPQQQQQQAQPAAQQQPYVDSAVALQQKRQFEPLWTPEMVEKTEQWMRDALKNLEKSDITYTVAPARFHMRITLSEPIFADREKEKQLLAHFATLILETLKRLGKSGLRGHKIVLTHRQ